MFIVGLVVFTAASLWCGLAPNAGTLIAGRLVQGVGAALMVPQVLTGIQLNFTGPARGRAFAYYALSLAGGAVAGQVLGGVLLWADLFGADWRPLFLINVPIGAILLVAALRYLPVDHIDDRGPAKKLDLGGVVAILAAILLLVVPLVMGREQGWPAWAFAALAASVPALVLFVAVERRVAARGGYPLLNLQIMTWPRIAWGLVAQMAVQSSYFAVLFTLALYLQQGLGHSPLYSGLALLSWVIAFGVAGFGVRRVPKRWSPLTPATGYLFLALVYVLLSVATGLGVHNGVLLMTLLGLGGAGLGTGFNSMIAHLTASLPGRYAPDFSGIHSTVLQVAGTLGVAVWGTFYLSEAPDGGRDPATHAFSVVCAALAASAFVAAVAAYRSTHAREITEEPPAGERTARRQTVARADRSG
ncbi:hypothetical protein GCM10022254_63620 [Actinomadura meridiana]|uniref:Major facilitator superfamily (MFS) profile domain-containing protein n=2 Tax=Actinomadura meridiana TaxID=559626 RepID=A0ABP8CJL2_9ACTN